MVSKYDFAYAVGVVRTLETHLLSENEVDRMVLAKDAKEAFRILNELDYADNKLGIEDPAEFQKVLTEGLIDIKKILEKITPDKRVLDILWHYYDFHNLKVILKAYHSGKEFEEIEDILHRMGSISIEAMRTYIYDNQEAPFGMPDETEKYLKSRIRAVQALFEKEKNPLIIDLYIDQKLIRIIRQIAEGTGNQFLIDYVKKLIDLTNIKLFFRMKSQDKSIELFEMAVLWKGHVPHIKFIDAYKNNLSEFPDVMKATAYVNIVSEGYRAYEEEQSFITLEKLIEDHLTEHTKRAKLVAFGPEPLIAYFLAKRNNAQIIRMILINKLNNIEPEEIRKKLRKLYI